jgi:formate dehydrogenase major subunit
VLDPFGKIPEFKYCAVRVSAGGAVTDRFGYENTAGAFAGSGQVPR